MSPGRRIWSHISLVATRAQVDAATDGRAISEHVMPSTANDLVIHSVWSARRAARSYSVFYFVAQEEAS